MDLATTRSGDAVRLTGTADFSGLVEGRDVVFFSVTFGGEIGGDQRHRVMATTRCRG